MQLNLQHRGGAGVMDAGRDSTRRIGDDLLSGDRWSSAVPGGEVTAVGSVFCFLVRIDVGEGGIAKLGRLRSLAVSRP